MITSIEPIDLIASFPAAGAGGTTLEQLEKLAVRRGMASGPRQSREGCLG
jgi:hypothetical protein